MDDFFDRNEEKEKAKEVNASPADDTVNAASQSGNAGSGSEYHYSYVNNNRNQYYNPPTNNSQSPNYTNYYTPPTSNQQYSQPNEQNGARQTVFNGQPVDNNEKPAKKKNKTLAVIITIVIVCVAVAVAGLVVSAMNRDSDSKDSNSVSQSDDKSAGDDVTVADSDSAAMTDKDGNLTAAGVAKKAMDSCVGITVTYEQSSYDYFYSYGYGPDSGSSNQNKGEGSGVIMKESNGTTYIMTCAHVIEDGSAFTVTLNNGKEYDAQLVGTDAQTDIGVLSVKATGLSVAEFGNSDDIQIGEECVAIGCPGGLEFQNSVTSGIVSALARPISSSIGYDNECIQVDAAINPGNSGGALFNMQGQVIGINSSKIAATDYEGMGFAVPSNTAVSTANALIKDGYVAGRAKLGIQYNSLSNFNNASSILAALEQKGFKDAQGTMVIYSIDDESDLKNKDIQQYDMIVAVNGKTMTSTDVMTSALSDSKPGDTVTLTIARIKDNSIKTFEVKCKLIESKE